MAANLPRYRKKPLSTQHATVTDEDAQPSKPEAQAQGSEPAKKWRHKVSFYQDRDFTDRVGGAITYTTSQEGPRTLTAFINGAIEREVERLEAKHNDGTPFPPIGPKTIPQGRPMGAE